MKTYTTTLLTRCLRRFAVASTGLLCLALIGCGKQQKKLSLSTDGKTKACITLADSASVSEKTAAAELASYLKKVTGAEFPVVKPQEAAGRPTIAVGPGAAKALLPDLDLVKLGEKGLGDDGIVLKSVGRNLILTGAEGSQRGTLYAVYEFLEREAGVRWWTHTEETVPQKPTLVVAPLDVRYKPPFLYREPFSWGITQGDPHMPYDDSDAKVKDWAVAKFAARQRNNGHGGMLPASLGGAIVPIGFVHTSFQYLPPAKYFKDHPEWYSEVKGQRIASGDKSTHFGEGRGQLCWSNEEMLQELTKVVLETIRKTPQFGMIDLSQNDWNDHCECSKCKALDDAGGSHSASLIHGVNRVAEAVEKEFSGFLVKTLAYQYTRKAPTGIRPRDNVLIQYCVIERGASQPIDSDQNRALLDDLKAWSAVAPKLFVWDYVSNVSGPLTPHPKHQVFAKDFRTYLDHHAAGVFLEGESIGATDFIGLKNYLMARLLWDPSRDESAVIDEFLNGYYGKAAPTLRQVLDLYAEKAGPAFLRSFMDGVDAEWLDLAAMNRATELFQQAENAVAGDPAELARVKRARIPLDGQWLRGYGHYREQAEREQISFLGPQDPAKAAADFASAVRLAATPLDQTWMRFIQRLMDMDYGYGQGEAGWNAYFEDFKLRAKPPAPLPEAFRGLPASRVIDMDEARCSLFRSTGAKIVEDPKASNGFAMRVPKAPKPSWGVQAHTKALSALGGFGRYRVHVVARCELQAESGDAFVAGIYDVRGKKGLGTVSFPIGKSASAADPKQVDENPMVLGDMRIGTPVNDAEYHVYDLGVYELSHSSIYAWVGTTNGDLFVDRFLFVKEP
ncbi:MAG: DUF4838 domain-containing protein [Verrucomicrobiota bacterium]